MISQKPPKKRPWKSMLLHPKSMDNILEKDVCRTQN
jgi:hypothetical protein